LFRRPRRGAPAAVKLTKSKNPDFAPPCLGEALRRGRIVMNNFHGSDYIWFSTSMHRADRGEEEDLIIRKNPTWKIIG